MKQASIIMLLLVLGFTDIRAVMWLYKHNYRQYKYVRAYSSEHKRLSQIIDSMTEQAKGADIYNVWRQYRYEQ
jgi:hypothetical protein